MYPYELEVLGKELTCYLVSETGGGRFDVVRASCGGDGLSGVTSRRGLRKSTQVDDGAKWWVVARSCYLFRFEDLPSQSIVRCSKCNVHVGWMFGEEVFYGLIITRLREKYMLESDLQRVVATDPTTVGVEGLHGLLTTEMEFIV